MEPLTEASIEELRIVADQQWFAAEQRLADEKERRTSLPKDDDRKTRPLMLNGFFWCPEHERPLQVGGANNRSMVCAACRGTVTEKRPLFSFLNRGLALRLTCETLTASIQNDDELVEGIAAACRRHAAGLQQPDESRFRTLRQEDEHLTRAIAFNMRQAGLPDVDEGELESTMPA